MKVAIVGGGIAGLTAAALLARQGQSVSVFEQAGHLGGRAETQTTAGFHFNLGPHALYRGGWAVRVLKELGIPIEEDKVGTGEPFAYRRDRILPLPTGPASLLTTKLFSIAGRLEVIRFYSSVTRIDPRPLAATSVTEWLASLTRRGEVRDFIAALIRVSSYCNAHDEMSAGAAIEQLQIAIRDGVTYLNGGWHTLVDRIQQRAVASGATIYTGAGVRAVEYEAGTVCGLRLNDGTFMPAASVILAVPPKTAASLLGNGAGPQLKNWIDAATPIQAASLDLGLRKLPRTDRSFALGIDVPLYLSVHSRWAELAPKPAGLIHVAKYLPSTGRTDPETDLHELERLMDVVQPGWQNEIVHRRFLPHLPVTHAIVRAQDGGLAGRPHVEAPAIKNVLLAGDWVGDQGMLADAAFASARQAARFAVGNERAMMQAQLV
jgi:phytoene dehydrogenase-like protein